MTDRLNFHGLLRAGQEARERKHRDNDMFERVFSLSREELEAECSTLGIAHADVADSELRQALIAAYRAVSDPPAHKPSA